VHIIENIVCFGYKPLTPAIMAYCAENSIGISYLTPNGKFQARVYGAQKGNVLLRKKQYSLFDNSDQSYEIARNIIAAKIHNSRNQLQRHLRNHQDCYDSDLIKSTISLLAHNKRFIGKADNLDSIRGIEGESANLYFKCFNSLITCKEGDMIFNGRTRRPPLDEVNALLSFTYVLIVNDIRSAIETTGLDPQVGFLHRLRPGRPSLALDIMEEFRSYIGDRLVLSLINNRQVSKKHFEILETGEVRIEEKTRKELITAYQKRKDEIITHPLLGEKTTIGLLFHIQAMLMAQYIRGDIETYPPFIVR
jgi:CRISPR-associated protein Cas1